MGKKASRSPDGVLRVEGIHLTFRSHDGKVIKEFVTDPSFFILETDSENVLSKKGKLLVKLHAEQVFGSIGKWREK